MSEEEITRYDEASKSAARTDFLSQLRQKTGRFAGDDSYGTIVNHLSNNLYVVPC